MQISHQAFEQSPQQAWQLSEREPVVITQQDDRRVMLSYDLYQRLMGLEQSAPKSKSNAERLGMSVADLARVDDVVFERLADLPKEIKL